MWLAVLLALSAVAVGVAFDACCGSDSPIVQALGVQFNVVAAISSLTWLGLSLVLYNGVLGSSSNLGLCMLANCALVGGGEDDMCMCCCCIHLPYFLCRLGLPRLRLRSVECRSLRATAAATRCLRGSRGAEFPILGAVAA